MVQIKDGSVQSRDGAAIAHIAGLDGLRGIAVLLVVLHHFGVPARFDLVLQNRLGEQTHRLLNSMWMGVDLFFVISGFLITSILLASRSSEKYYVLFYSRRALRILPLHFGILIVGAIVIPPLVPPFNQLAGEAFTNIIWLALYASNIAMALGVVTTFGVYDTLWSLAIEEQFYLLWPWLVRRINQTRLVWLCVATILVSPIARFVWLQSGLDFWGAYRFTLTRLDGLAVGALIALIYTERNRWWSFVDRYCKIGIAISGVALLVLYGAVDSFYPSTKIVLILGHSVLSIFFGFLLVWIIGPISNSPPRFLTRGLLARLGIYSYGIYVLHWPLLLVLKACGGACMVGAAQSLSGSVVFLLLSVAASVALGAASYHGYERFFLRLRSRIPY